MKILWRILSYRKFSINWVCIKILFSVFFHNWKVIYILGSKETQTIKLCMIPLLRCTLNILDYPHPDEDMHTHVRMCINWNTQVINSANIGIKAYTFLCNLLCFTLSIRSFSHHKYFATTISKGCTKSSHFKYNCWISRLFQNFDMINNAMCPPRFYFKSSQVDIGSDANETKWWYC